MSSRQSATERSCFKDRGRGGKERREEEGGRERGESVFMLDMQEVKAWERLPGLDEDPRKLHLLRAQNSDFQMVDQP